MNSECDDSATIVSVISSQWCSIEERLNLLDKLLYCDEFDNDDEDNYSTISNSECLYRDDIDDNYYENEENDSLMSDHSGSGQMPMKRRGHQHHPRFVGTRRSNVPVEEILAALRRGDSVGELSNLSSSTTNNTTAGSSTADSTTVTSELHTSGSTSTLDTFSNFDDIDVDDPDDRYLSPTELPPHDSDSTILKEFNRNSHLESGNGNHMNDVNIKKTSLNLPLLQSNVSNTATTTITANSNSPTPTDESSLIDDVVKVPLSSNSTKCSKQQRSPKKDKIRSSDKKKLKKSKTKEQTEATLNTPQQERSEGDGAVATNTNNEINSPDNILDDDSSEWAKLRCTSERTEVVAEREIRRHKGRCADYPGLAFGRSIFSSDTMMKFNIIRNELHNIMNTQLKRVNKHIKHIQVHTHLIS